MLFEMTPTRLAYSAIALNLKTKYLKLIHEKELIHLTILEAQITILYPYNEKLSFHQNLIVNLTHFHTKIRNVN